jgi:PAS domain-containing protein
MHKSLQELCLEMAWHAEENRYSVLAYLLEVAAAEAERSVPMSHVARFPAHGGTTQTPIGVWDWDISNNASYLNAVGGALFGKDAKDAARGLPQSEYLDLMHPDDVARFIEVLNGAVSVGGAFTHDYRIMLNDRTRWVRSSGSCSLDGAGRPTRAFGSLVDITDLRLANARRSGIELPSKGESSIS